MRHSDHRLKIVTYQTVTKEEPASPGRTLPQVGRTQTGLAAEVLLRSCQGPDTCAFFEALRAKARIASKSSTLLKRA